MKKMIALALSGLLLLTGCAPTSGTLLTKDISPVGSTADVSDSLDFSTVSDFGMTMFQKALTSGKTNTVLSPVSAYLCLAMVMNGASTETLQQFSDVLGADNDTVNRLCQALRASLSDVAGSTRQTIADSVWIDDDRAVILESYLRDLVNTGNAEIFSADLPSTAARNAVNNWVKEKTNGLIPVLHEENYPDETVMVLLNTLYFKAKWLNPFLPYQTSDSAFETTDGKTVTVPFLYDYEAYRSCIREEGAEGIVLPYDDDRTVFLALRPTDGGSIADFAASLSSDTLLSYLDSAEETLVNFSMPKWNVSYGANLNDILQSMGLTNVFDAERADLSRMGKGVDGTPLYLSKVLQKVRVIVDEEGTEAAAVTEAAMATGAMLPENPPFELHLDRPFVYAIVDRTTGVPLFIGSLDDPSLA